MRGGAQVVYGNANWSAPVVGITPEFFEAREWRVLSGRPISQDDVDGRAKVAVLGLTVLEQLFGDSNPMERVIRVRNVPFTVVGVAERRFRGVWSPNLIAADMWISLSEARRLPGWLKALQDRDAGRLMVVARLKPGIDLPSARMDTAAVGLALEREFPTSPGRSRRVFTIQRFTDIHIHQSVDRVAVPMVTAVLVLAALILLIGIANVTSLLLAQGDTRAAEMAVRVSLGATRYRLVRQMITEAAVFAVIGGMVALALALPAVTALGRWSTTLAAEVRLSIDAAPDWKVFAYCALCSVIAAFASGVLPGLRASQQSPVRQLGQQSATFRVRRFGLSHALLVPQLVAVMTLITVAAMFLRDTASKRGTDCGVALSELAFVTLDLSGEHSTESTARVALTHLAEQASRLRAVQSVSVADALPFRNARIAAGFVDRPPAGATNRQPDFFGYYIRVGSTYFSTVKTPIVAGRGFDERDVSSAHRVAVVSQQAARELWPNEPPVGHYLALNTTEERAQFTREAAQGEMAEVVGVAADTDVGELGKRRRPLIYLPLEQDPSGKTMLLVRSDSPMQTLGMVSSLLRHDASHAILLEAHTGSDVVADSYRLSETAQRLTGVMGIAGLLLAIVGLFGSTAYAVSRRTREIAVRIALGSPPYRVIGGLLRETAWVLCLGTGIGILTSRWTAMVVARVVFGVRTPTTIFLLAVASIFALVSFLACYLPARTASRANPVEALKAQ